MKNIFILIFVIVFVMVSAFTVLADELSEALNSKKHTENEINNIRQQKSKQKDLLNQMEGKKKYILEIQEESEEEYQDKIKEINKINLEIQKYDNCITEAEKKYEKEFKRLKSRLRIMCKNTVVSYVQILIESEGISDFLERLQLIKLIVKKDNKTIKQFINIKKDLEFKKGIVSKSKYARQEELDTVVRSLEEIKVSRADINRKITDINTKINQLEWQLDELNKKAKELEDIINSLIKTKGSYVGGKMTWPVPSCHHIVSYYGMRLHPIFKVRKMHTGIDIDANWKKSIVAVNTGTVILAGWQSGYGNTVVINHGGGISTLYAHCNSILVRPGSYVEKGDVIARIGSTGLSTGPHLHFEVRERGKTVNPLNYVSP